MKAREKQEIDRFVVSFTDRRNVLMDLFWEYVEIVGVQTWLSKLLAEGCDEIWIFKDHEYTEPKHLASKIKFIQLSSNI